MNLYKPGDRVRVVEPYCSFGDYEVGDTAVVSSTDRADGLYVSWDKPLPDPDRNKGRCDFLFTKEVAPA
jgi:hypothetical protein